MQGSSSFEYSYESSNPVETGRKLKVQKTFRRRPGRFLNVLYTFNLRPVSAGCLLKVLKRLSAVSWIVIYKIKHFDEPRNLKPSFPTISRKAQGSSLPVQSQQCKHLKNDWNIFKVNNKDTRTMTWTSFCCFYS